MRLSIPGFSNYYLDTDDNYVYNLNGRRMSEYIHYNKYGKHPVAKLSLTNDRGELKNVFKHRIVYTAYHPNEDISDLQINHLDENSLNNDISNLETCTAKENMNWGTVKQRLSEDRKGILNNHRSIPVVAYYLDDYEVEHYPSIAEAGRQLGIDYKYIIDCCKGYRVQYAGRIWQYERR